MRMSIGIWSCATGLAGVAAVLLALAVPTALAQSRRGAGAPRYDKSTETTITGVVSDVRTVAGPGQSGLHLTLDTANGPVDVHLGPAAWMTRQQFQVAKGDSLEILGSKVTVDGQPAFIARTVTRGDQTMVLRNENGIPRWSGRGGAGAPF
jgi:hypothetical protein